MVDTLLVLDAGSSSLKFAVYAVAQPPARAPQRLVHGQVDGLGSTPHFTAHAADGPPLADAPLAIPPGGAADHAAAIGQVLAWLQRHADGSQRLVAAGHRVVHGGTRFAAPVRLDEAVLQALAALTPLAPLHQPPALAAIRALRAQRPQLPQVACFDTAFHHTQPAVAQACALPPEFAAEGIRRYGFHGLSYQHIAQVLPDLLGAQAEGRVVVAHLGNGASLCALQGRRSVATTMGFTALDGLVMGTRCGLLDPGVVLHLIQQRGMTAEQVSTLLYQRSGLLGVSGLSSDMRVLAASAAPAAAEAIALYVYRLVRELGSMAAALGGLDALVFTAGIGKHAADIRAQVCAGSAWLGVVLDEAANAAHRSRISAAGSPVSVWVIPADEEGVIAQAVVDTVPL